VLDLATALRPLRRRFYELGGPWYRCRLFETLGSRRYSQPALFGMDARLAELMPWQGGTFVEAGAHDGYTQSNTYYLERWRGWSGVLVEPIPELRKRCQRRRPRSNVVGCALVGPDFASDAVAIRRGDLMSTIVPSATSTIERPAAAQQEQQVIDVPARTLSAVLEDAGVSEVDVLVLDLEGAELEAIAGLDLERHAPRYILVEALDRAEQQPDLDAALAPEYEFDVLLSDYDLLYRRST
jgi:FkbM family methyltransferase